VNIIVRATVMQDKIKDLLDGGVFGGFMFSFVEKKGLELTFSVSGDDAETTDVAAIAKSAIKSTDYGKGIFFSVRQV